MKRTKLLFFLLMAIMSMFSLNIQADRISVGPTTLSPSTTTYTNDNLSYITSGKIIYDENAKTITLDNAVINTGSNVGISFTDFQSFTLILKGQNTISCDSHAIWANGNSPTLTITSSDGNGSLKASSLNAACLRTEEGTSLIIKKCSLEIEGKGGISGWRNGTDTECLDITIDNATVKATGRVVKAWREFHYGSIGNTRSITLKNCYISQPSGVEFGRDDIEQSWGYYTINSNGEKWLTADQVVILPQSVQGLTKPADCLYFTTEEAGNEVGFLNNGKYTFPTFVYSTDGSQWFEYTIGDLISLPNVGDKVYFMAKDKNERIAYNNNYYIYFTATKKVAASGSIMSLLDNTCQQTSLPDYGFIKLFYNCTNLTKAPKLPATTLNWGGYNSMFYGCTSLTTAPELPAKEMAANCYRYMFQGCTSLTKAPELPATTLDVSCYADMFVNCTSLTAAPKLPVTTLANNCYYNMFNGCTNLTAAPELPATTLAIYCYSFMFTGCTSLTKAPELPATTLVDGCYDHMFTGCKKINSISVNFTEWNPKNATSEWLQNVASTGTFICPEGLAQTRSTSNIPTNWTVCNLVNGLTKPADCLYFTTEEAGNEVGFKNDGTYTLPNFVYSTDGSHWYKYTIGDLISLPNVGDKVYFMAKDKNEYTAIGVNTDFIYFTATKKVAANGSIMSLLDNTCKQTDLTEKYTFTNLFRNCKNLTKAPKLPATTLSWGCYWNMFYGCKGLTEAPNLPAMNLTTACYSYMFDGCTSLTTAPELPATTLGENCYSYMFEYCVNLTTAPKLPVTTLTSDCYRQMFHGCKNLTKAPELPATTLASYCYFEMFKGCTSLTTAPYLPATTLAKYCYYEMFEGCNNLNSVTVNLTSWETEVATTDWLNQVASTGTFYCPEGLAQTRGTSNIPEGWTIVNHLIYDKPEDCLAFTTEEAGNRVGFKITGTLSSTPELVYSTDGMKWHKYTFGNTISLPKVGDKVYFMAKSSNEGNTFSTAYNEYITFYALKKIAASGSVMSLLDNTCKRTDVPYYGFTSLFANNSNLTTAPTLPATTLAEGCYYNMFTGCTSLTTAPALPAKTLADACYYYMFKGCTSLTAAPALPATTLKSRCYQAMFYNCTSLTAAPELPATTLVNFCYYQMFYGCSSLNSINVSFTDWAPTGIKSPTLNWLYNVAKTGRIICKEGFDTSKSGSTYIPEGWTVCYPVNDLTKPKDCLCFTTEEAENPVKFLIYGELTTTPNLVYSTDGKDWFKYSFGSEIWLPNIGDKVYFMALDKNDTFSENNNNLIMFTAGKKVAASGSVMSLLDNTCKKTEVPTAAFMYLFSGCTSLTTAPKLPATTLKTNCYALMFTGCSGLKSAPYLPATTMASSCYRGMFYNCVNLTNAPKLSATTLATSCYRQMFYNCTSLTKAPELPATTLAQTCYAAMFCYCTSLTNAPELPATELANGCYASMFSDCTSLTTAPELPATELVSGCYSGMFKGCTSLNIMKVNFTDWNTDATPTTDWLSGVSATGTFYCPTDLQETLGDSFIPEGWAINKPKYLTKPENCLAFTAENNSTKVSFDITGTLTTTPKLVYSTDGTTWYDYTFGEEIALNNAGDKVYFMALDKNDTFSTGSNYIKFSATNKVAASGSVMSLLDKECKKTDVPSYAFCKLFFNNSNLTTAPELPATTLASYCYSYMFYGCTSLTTAPELPATTLASYCYSFMFYGCTSLTTAPELPATTLVDRCYAYMFDGCTKLNSITVSFTNWTPTGVTNPTSYWLGSVANKGTFYCPKELKESTKTRGESTIPYYWTVIDPIQDLTKPDDCLCFTTEEAENEVRFTQNNDWGTNALPQLVYSTNGTTWYDYTFEKYISLPNVGDKVYFMAKDKNETFACDNAKSITFEATKKVAASGSVMSLLDNTCKQTSVPYACFSLLFNNCQNLTAAPQLPATTLAEMCYYMMFANCSNLTTAPELPATELKECCYLMMFYGCAKLNSITVGFSDWNTTDATTLWLLNVANTGTFICPSDLPQTTGASNIPSGWTVKSLKNSVLDLVNLINRLNDNTTNVKIEDINSLVDKLLGK